jgi:hypothetical protein
MHHPRRFQPVSILANLVPLAGVLLFGWNMLTILLLYWAENAIIGVFNALKMGVIARTNRKPQELALIAFFLFHYGIFWAGHGVFLLVGGTLTGLVGQSELQEILTAGWFFADSQRLVSLLALAAGHAYAFLVHFLRPRLYHSLTVDAQMVQPYGRVIVMHVTILGSAALTVFLGWQKAPVPVILLVLLKILFEGRPLGTIPGKRDARGEET